MDRLRVTSRRGASRTFFQHGRPKFTTRLPWGQSLQETDTQVRGYTVLRVKLQSPVHSVGVFEIRNMVLQEQRV